VAAVATVILWTAKAVAIGVAGGLGKSPLEGPLFLLGLLTCVVAGVLVGAAVFAHRSVGWRVLGALVSVVATSLLGTLAQVVVVAVQPRHPGWVYGEINLWVITLALLAAALGLGARARRSGRSLTSAREDTRDRDRRTRARVGARPLP
jgi:hypothetical protein